MNDTIYEINKLQKILDTISKNIPWSLHVASVRHELRELISEKQKQLTKFEIENMSYEQYQEFMKGRGFND